MRTMIIDINGTDIDDYDDDDDGDDCKVRRFPLTQPLLFIAIDSKVRQLFPAIAEEEVMIVIVILIFIIIVVNIPMISVLSWLVIKSA